MNDILWTPKKTSYEVFYLDGPSAIYEGGLVIHNNLIQIGKRFIPLFEIAYFVELESDDAL